MNYYSILDHVFVMRPMLHLPVWTITILGFYAFEQSSEYNISLLTALAVVSGLSAAAFLLNQIYDIDSDRVNNKLHFLPRQYVRVGTAWVMFILLTSVSLILAVLISIKVALVSLLIMLLGILYSVPPAALKNRAWPAAFANGLGPGALAFILGYCAAGGSSVSAAVHSLPYFSAVIAVYIGTTIPDIEGDKKSGKLTIGIIYGQKESRHLIMIFYVLSVLAGLIVHDRLFLIAALISLPFYIRLADKKTDRSIILAVKISILSLSFVVFGIYPLYAIFVVLLILFTRAYYQGRFRMKYPSLN